jgi:hypothetical protein
MLGLLVPLLLRFNPLMKSQTAEKLSKWMSIALLILAAVIGFSIWLSSVKREAVDDHTAQVEARAGEARETAAETRAEDALKNYQNEEDLHEAIDSAPDGSQLSAPARALSCERLRKLGRVPPACRPQSSNGKQANSGR